jgi:hypothetical protein
MKNLLFILLVLIPCLASAQVKIGDITLTDKEAKEYLLDCYSYPDTIWFPNGYTQKSGTRSWRNEIEDKAIEWVFPEKPEGYDPYAVYSPNIIGYVVRRTPSAYDYMLYVERKNNNP